MNCNEVQLKFPEILDDGKNYLEEIKHIKNCESCKIEFENFKLISEKIHKINDPISSIISRQNQQIIISKIERQSFVNRIRIITSVAAVIIISLISTIIFQQRGQVDFYYGDSDVNTIAYNESDAVIEFELSDEEILNYLISTETKANLDEIVEMDFADLENKNGS